MKIHNVKYLSSYSDRMLSIRQKSINDSIKKLSSGSRYLKSQDDAAMLSVKLKMDAARYKNESARNKLANAVSFTDLQDGMLSNAQSILSRMSELKGLSINDPLKSQQDIEAYNNEFHNLQKELFEVSKTTFNGLSLFATTVESTGGNEVSFKGGDNEINSTTLITDSAKISIQKLPLLAALTIRLNDNTLSAINDPTYGTGYDSTGKSILSGTSDSNWSANGGDAIKANLSSPGSGIEWIEAASGGTQDSNGSFWDTYKTTFDMSGFKSPSMAIIGPGSILGDDHKVYLNGDLVIDRTGVVNGGRWNSNSGLNELEVKIKRSLGGRSALALNYSINATPIGQFILNTKYSDRVYQNETIALGVESDVSLSNLNNIPMSYLNQALENLSYLRSQTAAISSRLKFTSDLEYMTKSNVKRAYSRISDVNYASESSRLARHKIMTSSSAAMIAQANTLGDIAMIMLN